MTADYRLLEEVPTLNPLVTLDTLSVDRMIETYTMFRDAAWNNEKLLQTGLVTRERPLEDIKSLLGYIESVTKHSQSVRKIRYPFPYKTFKQEERDEMLQRVVNGVYETKTFEVNELFVLHYVVDTAEKIFANARKFESVARIYKSYLVWRLSKTEDQLKEIDETIVKSQEVSVPGLELKIPGISTKELFKTDYDAKTDIVTLTVDSPYNKFSVPVNVSQGTVQPLRPRTVDFLASEAVQSFIFTNPVPQLAELQKLPEENPIQQKVSYGHEMASRNDLKI